MQVQWQKAMPCPIAAANGKYPLSKWMFGLESGSFLFYLHDLLYAQTPSVLEWHKQQALIIVEELGATRSGHLFRCALLSIIIQ